MGGDGVHLEVPLFELDAVDLVDRVNIDDAVKGCLIMEREADGTIRGGRLGYRPRMLIDDVRQLGEWATVRVARFLEHGPEPDGWQRRSDGAWQLWARLHEMPSLD